MASARAKLALLGVEGLSNNEVAARLGWTGLDWARLGWSRPTMGKWRQRFLKDRLQGLYGEIRAGRPRLVSDERVAERLGRPLKQKPTAGTQWTVRLAAETNGPSTGSFSFSLQPHQNKSLKLSRLYKYDFKQNWQTKCEARHFNTKIGSFLPCIRLVCVSPDKAISETSP